MRTVETLSTEFVESHRSVFQIFRNSSGVSEQSVLGTLCPDRTGERRNALSNRQQINGYQVTRMLARSA